MSILQKSQKKMKFVNAAVTKSHVPVLRNHGNQVKKKITGSKNFVVIEYHEKNLFSKLSKTVCSTLTILTVRMQLKIQ